MRMLGISPNFYTINEVWVNESEIHISHSVIFKEIFLSLVEYQ